MSVAVNPRILKSVREQRALSLPAVAKHTTISLQRLKEFEEGTRFPSFRQASKLAQAYGIKSYFLFGDSVPNVPPPPKDFRSRDEHQARLSPKGYRAILFSEHLSEFAQETLKDRNPGYLKIESNGYLGMEGIQKAEELRAEFDEWYNAREEALGFAGSKQTVFYSALKLFIEAHGRIVRTDDAPPNDFKGFYFSPTNAFPNVFVNRKIFSKRAQLFTLAHEYAHALLDAEGVSDPFRRQNQVEVQCNRFAAKFLAPESLVKGILEKTGRTVFSDPINMVNFLSRHTLLSNSAAAIRLKELEFLSEGQLKKILTVLRSSYRREKDEETARESIDYGWPHAKRLSEIGTLTAFAAGNAIKAGEIDSVDVVKSIRLALSVQDRAFSLANRRIEVALS